MTPTKPQDVDLCGDPIATPHAVGTAIQLVKSAAAQRHKPSPAQLWLNKLMGRIGHLTSDLQRLDQLKHTYQAPHHQAMAVLEREVAEQKKAIALKLHEHLEVSNLTVVQRRDLSDVVTSLLRMTEHMQDPALLALMGDYIPQHRENEALKKSMLASRAAQLRKMVEELLDPEEADNIPDDPDELMAILHSKMAQTRAQEGQEDAFGAHSTRKRKRPSAPEQQSQQQAQDTKATLRSIFRQLASSLHPDRETNPVERERKTALMSQVNAAYKRQDVAALLHMQVHMLTEDATTEARGGAQQIESMTRLLKQQVASLSADVELAEMSASQALGMSLSAQTHDTAIERGLKQQRSQLQQRIQQLRNDVQAIQEASNLKAWLKQQRQIQKKLARQQAVEQALLGRE
ncbi:MAG: hypothetical protein QMC46_01615 [Burkholderiaceae bacterium]